MTVVASVTDVDALTLTFVTELDADAERVWQLWADPRQLELWWGPPTWPATFDTYAFEPGGYSHYHLTGPEGDELHCWWRILALDAPNRLEIDDGVATRDGTPLPDVPVRLTVTIEQQGSRTTMTAVNRFASTEHLEALLETGMESGMRTALGQLDALISPSADVLHAPELHAPELHAPELHAPELHAPELHPRNS